MGIIWITIFIDLSILKGEEMKTLYIIGNGFDIAHGLDTSYWNFRTYLENVDYEFLLAFEKLYNIAWLDQTEYGYSERVQKKWDKAIKEKLWSEFEQNIGVPDIQSMLDNSSSILDNLCLESGNIGIQDTMDEYWKQEFGFVSKLQSYVKDWIEQIDIKHIAPKKKALIGDIDSYYLNFNYTNLLEEIYGIDNVLHIHGSVGKNADIDPFMGHCNSDMITEHEQKFHEAYESSDEGSASIHNAIVNYLNEIYKDTSQYIFFNKYFFQRLKEVDNVIIIGWSAGEVDIPYLCRIRDSISKSAKWTVYYYDATAYDKLSKALSDNDITGNFATEFL